MAERAAERIGHMASPTVFGGCPDRYAIGMDRVTVTAYSCHCEMASSTRAGRVVYQPYPYLRSGTISDRL